MAKSEEQELAVEKAKLELEKAKGVIFEKIKQKLSSRYRKKNNRQSRIWEKKVPFIAEKLNKLLLKQAKSLDEFQDEETLEKRLYELVMSMNYYKMDSKGSMERISAATHWQQSMMAKARIADSSEYFGNSDDESSDISEDEDEDSDEETGSAVEESDKEESSEEESVADLTHQELALLLDIEKMEENQKKAAYFIIQSHHNGWIPDFEDFKMPKMFRHVNKYCLRKLYEYFYLSEAQKEMLFLDMGTMKELEVDKQAVYSIIEEVDGFICTNENTGEYCINFSELTPKCQKQLHNYFHPESIESIEEAADEWFNNFYK